VENELFDRLSRMNALETLDDGTKGVRVSLQSNAPLASGTRLGRRASLEQRFADVAKGLAKVGAKVNLQTISVSAQTVEAVLPVERYDDVKHDLERIGIRVDELIDRLIV
jgi:hypothetical protein